MAPKWTFHREEGKDKGRPRKVVVPPKRWTFHDGELQPDDNATGWRVEEPEGRGMRFTCDYVQGDGSPGCKSFIWESDPEPGQYHAWDCPYWNTPEGREHSPF